MDSVKIEWDDANKRVIVIRFAENWRWDHLLEIEERADVLLNEVKHKVAFLIDASQVAVVPTGTSIKSLRKVVELQHPNSDIIVVIVTQYLIRGFLRTIVRSILSRDRIYFCGDEAEARILLETHRQPML